MADKLFRLGRKRINRELDLVNLIRMIRLFNYGIREKNSKARISKLIDYSQKMVLNVYESDEIITNDIVKDKDKDSKIVSQRSD